MSIVDREVQRVPHGRLLARINQIQVHPIATFQTEYAHSFQIVEVFDRAAQATDMHNLFKATPGWAAVPRIVLVYHFPDLLDQLRLILR